jgi:hypothetical protein
MRDTRESGPKTAAFSLSLDHERNAAGRSLSLEAGGRREVVAQCRAMTKGPWSRSERERVLVLG